MQTSADKFKYEETQDYLVEDSQWVLIEDDSYYIQVSESPKEYSVGYFDKKKSLSRYYGTHSKLSEAMKEVISLTLA